MIRAFLKCNLIVCFGCNSIYKLRRKLFIWNPGAYFTTGVFVLVCWVEKGISGLCENPLRIHINFDHTTCSVFCTHGPVKHASAHGLTVSSNGWKAHYISFNTGINGRMFPLLIYYLLWAFIAESNALLLHPCPQSHLVEYQARASSNEPSRSSGSAEPQHPNFNEP